MKSIKKILATLLLLTVIVSGVSSINAYNNPDALDYGFLSLDENHTIYMELYSGGPLADELGTGYIYNLPTYIKYVDKNLWGWNAIPFIIKYYTQGEIYFNGGSGDVYNTYIASGLFTIDSEASVIASKKGYYMNYLQNDATHSLTFLDVS
jgi:hypothetical protein